MKKNLISLLLLIAVVLLALAGYKYWSDNKTIPTWDLVDMEDDIGIDLPADILTGTTDTEVDEDIDVATGDTAEVLFGDVAQLATGTVDDDVVAVPSEDDTEAVDIEPEQVEDIPTAAEVVVEVEEQVEVTDEDFDPKEFEDAEITELMELLKTMLE